MIVGKKKRREEVSKLAVVIEETKEGIYRIGLTDGEIDKFIFWSDTERGATDCASELKKWLEHLVTRRRPWGVMC